MQNWAGCSGLPVATATSGTITLTDTRDNNTYTVAKLADGRCWMTRNLNLAGGSTVTSANSNVTSDYTLPASNTSGFTDNNTAYVYNSDTVGTNPRTEYGGYYSWRAATAGVGTTSVTSGNVSSDICPKGWRLPTKVEFDTLLTHYGTMSALTTSPVNMKTAGIYYVNSFGFAGSRGDYWSSTAVNSSSSYRLTFTSSGANTPSDVKYCGDSVRCVYGS